MNSAITVALIEDQAGFRHALQELLSRDPGIHCIGAYANPKLAVEEIPIKSPDIVVVDLRLPRMSGIECISLLKSSLPKLKVLILTAYEERDELFAALRAGADGYLLKSAAHDQVVPAIFDLMKGGAPMSPSIAAEVIRSFHGPREHHSQPSLSPREQEVLGYLAQGLLYKEIAEKMGISFQTVSTHLKKVYEKLNVRSRTEAVMKVQKHSSKS